MVPMEYKKKVVLLLSLTAVLALTYIASLIFDPELAASRSASHIWLDSKLAARISKIVIKTEGEEKEFVKKDGRWFVLHNGREYPARQLRVEDFIGIFTTRAAWPVRYSNASSHARLGLAAETAYRVTLFAENSSLVDLLFGYEDSTGRGINVRKYGQNEVRSGNNAVVSYITSPANSWFNLRLIPESEDGKIDVDGVQRLSVFREEGTQVFSRRNREWIVSGLAVENPNQNAIETYIRIILNTEGSDFDNSVSIGDPAFTRSRIVLELGNGSVITIRLTEADETGRRFANIADSDFVYSLAPWAAQRLFMNASDFERQ
jgi:hypothetical protein